MDAIIASGSEDRITASVRELTGKSPTSYEDFARREFRLAPTA